VKPNNSLDDLSMLIWRKVRPK